MKKDSLSANRRSNQHRGFRRYSMPEFKCPLEEPHERKQLVIVVGPHGFWIARMTAREIAVYRRAYELALDRQVARGVIV